MAFSRRQIQELKGLLRDQRDIEWETKAYGCLDRELHQPLVYFIQIADQPESPIKIGYTECLKDRLSGLQMCCPFKLKILGVMAGGKEAEGRLHESFSHAHVQGEWFRPTEGLLALISGLPLDLPE